MEAPWGWATSLRRICGGCARSATCRRTTSANIAEITRNYVGMIERRESSPTVDVIEKLAKALSRFPFLISFPNR
jgi:transcriptional regulator with XRE-family HTH domain